MADFRHGSEFKDALRVVEIVLVSESPISCIDESGYPYPMVDGYKEGE